MAIFLILLSLIFASDKKEDKSNLVKVNIIQSDRNHQNEDIYLLFQLNIKDHWHTYWRNPGDSGLPTDIKIETQDNVKVSEIIWPEIPEKIPFDDLANFGFSDQQNLIIKISPDNEQKDLNLKAKISWLVCKEECIPQDTTISLNIPYHMDMKISKKDTENTTLINNLIANQPKKKDISYTSAKIDGDYVVLESQDDFFKIYDAELSFFAFEGGYYSNSIEPEITRSNNLYQIKFKLDDYKIDNPNNINGLFVVSKDDKRTAFEVNIPIN